MSMYLRDWKQARRFNGCMIALVCVNAVLVLWAAWIAWEQLT